MPAERLSMRKVREVLRLKYALGMSYRRISAASGAGKTQAADYVRRAALAGITWPVPEELVLSVPTILTVGGRAQFSTSVIPKIIDGDGTEAAQIADALSNTSVPKTEPVSKADVAAMGWGRVARDAGDFGRRRPAHSSVVLAVLTSPNQPCLWSLIRNPKFATPLANDSASIVSFEPDTSTASATIGVARCHDWGFDGAVILSADRETLASKPLGRPTVCHPTCTSTNDDTRRSRPPFAWSCSEGTGRARADVLEAIKLIERLRMEGDHYPAMVRRAL
jgi:hypothetical protein